MKNLLLLIVLSSFIACANENSSTVKTTAKELAMNTSPTIKPIPSKEEVNTMKDYKVEYIMGKFDPTSDKDFIEIEIKHASRKGMYLRKDAYAAFIKMAEAAAKEGLVFKILSATRPFNHQKRIWEDKWNGRRQVGGNDLSKTMHNHEERAIKILEYSSMPGTSRHHWGTDIDINAFENSYFEKGKGKKEYDWLVANANRFGFCQPYTPKGKERPNGYNEEKWHWSYLPVALDLTKNAEAKMKDEMITGFDGSETATKIQVVKNYILGINKSCK